MAIFKILILPMHESRRYFHFFGIFFGLPFTFLDLVQGFSLFAFVSEDIVNGIVSLISFPVCHFYIGTVFIFVF